MSEANRKTIADIYAAFGRGEVAHILEHSAERTLWDFNVAAGSLVPFHAPAEGRAGLPGFFAALAESVRMERFEPYFFACEGREVIVRVRIAYTVHATGKRVAQEQVHWWTLDEGGRVASLRHFEDTASVQAAFRA